MEEEDLLYYDKQQEKSALIQTQRFPAWEIHILPEKMNLPREGQGATIGDRPEIEADMRFVDYAKLLKGEVKHPDRKPIRDAKGLLVYRGETGLTPEIEVALAFVQLRENKQVLHDGHKNLNDTGCALSGCVTKNRNIPFSLFNLRDGTGQVFLSHNYDFFHNKMYGFVSSVKVC